MIRSLLSLLTPELFAAIGLAVAGLLAAVRQRSVGRKKEREKQEKADAKNADYIRRRSDVIERVHRPEDIEFRD